jgi:hypothetical protein
VPVVVRGDDSGRDILQSERTNVPRAMASTALSGGRADAGAGAGCVLAGRNLLLARDRQHRSGENKAGEPFWVLEIRQKDKVPVTQEMLNHWGMAAPDQAAVDEAYKNVNERKQEFGIVRVQKPRFRHGSYACYFVDVDSNWWELEYRAPEITYEALRAKGDLHKD